MAFVTDLSSSSSVPTSSSHTATQLAEKKSNNNNVCISNNGGDDDEIDESISTTEVSYSTTTSTAEDNDSNNSHLIVHASNSISITEITGAEEEKKNEENINVNATTTSKSSSYVLGAKQSDSIPFKAEGNPAPKATFQLQDFKRHKILGEGMFGQVWLASCAHNSSDNENGNDSAKQRHQPHCAFYALKIQSKFELSMEGQIENAIREKEIMSKLQQQQQHHPFLSNLIDTFQDESFVYLVLDLVQGGELFSLLHNMDTGDSLRLPETQARFYALCLADALAYLHSLMVVYRDLKPENVMIDDKGYPVLVDFGNAKVLGGNGGCPNASSKACTLCGTPAYCSPEMIQGQGYDYSTDYWSLGIILHEMLLGGHPFYYDYNNDGGTMDQMALFEAIVEDEYTTHPSPPDGISISPEAMDLMSKLLVKDPIQRLGCRPDNGGRRRKHNGSDENDILAHVWWWLLSEGGEAIIMEDYMDALRRNEITAPWIPAIGKQNQDPLGAGCFDDWDHLQDKTVTEYPLVEPKDARKFINARF